MTTRADIHSLVDRLSDEQLEAAGRSLEAIRAGADDPLVKLLLSAPYDDEPCSDEERKSSDEAWARYQQGDYVELGAFKKSLADG